MKTQITRILGMLSFLVGLIFFIQPSLTGFVVARDISNMGDFIGIIFVLVGIVLVGMARKPDYNYVAAQIYESLFLDASYGHHTKNTTDLTRRIARGSVSKQDVLDTINREVDSGRLRQAHGTSVSLSLNPRKLQEIGTVYGGYMRPVVRQRLVELRKNHRLTGSR